MNELRQWVVAANQDGVRLDAFLAARLRSWSRRETAELIVSGQVLLNGHTGKKGIRVHRGDTITAYLVPSLRPNDTLQIKVVHADEILVVLDKPAGIPSSALRHSETNTVANFLLAHFPDTSTASPRPLEAGLVHRLDTATSGLLLAARTPSAYSLLREQFRVRTVEKYYIAFVEGGLHTPGRVTSSLAPIGHKRQHMQVVVARKQHALTLYTPLEALPGHTLVKVRLVTGVRHQIRAHMAMFGYPIAGDVRYGASGGAARLYLHAEAIAFTHPATGQRVRFTSPLPSDFLGLVESLRARKTEPKNELSNETE